jgi:hypothetical protein
MYCSHYSAVVVQEAEERASFTRSAVAECLQYTLARAQLDIV